MEHRPVRRHGEPQLHAVIGRSVVEGGAELCSEFVASISVGRVMTTGLATASDMEPPGSGDRVGHRMVAAGRARRRLARCLRQPSVPLSGFKQHRFAALATQANSARDTPTRPASPRDQPPGEQARRSCRREPQPAQRPAERTSAQADLFFDVLVSIRSRRRIDDTALRKLRVMHHSAQLPRMLRRNCLIA